MSHYEMDYQIQEDLAAEEARSRIDGAGRFIGHRYCECDHMLGAHAIGEPRRCTMDGCACAAYRYRLTGGTYESLDAPAAAGGPHAP